MFVNEARWVRGAVPFQGDIGSYRQYLINHEVGHAIGYQRHEGCRGQRRLAPIMMQQTFSTSNDDAAKFDPETVKADGLTCKFNPLAVPDRLTTITLHPVPTPGTGRGVWAVVVAERWEASAPDYRCGYEQLGR